MKYFRFLLFTHCIAFIFHITIAYNSIANSLGSDWRIHIKEASVVHGDMVTLDDIAKVYGNPPPGVWEKISSIPLWKSPEKPGVPMKINRVRLEKALKETLGEASFLSVIPSNVAIQKGGEILYESQLQNLIQKAIENVYPMLTSHGELSDYRIPPYIFIPQKGQYVEVVLPTISPKRLSLQFVLKDIDGTILRQYTGTVLLSIWQPVPSAGKPLNRGDYVNPEDITWINKNIAFLRDDIWDGKGGPWQIKRSIGIGQPIYRSDLEPLAIVRKGNIIKLNYNKGSIHLSVNVEALEDGTYGSFIQVRNLQSKKIVYATVVDSNTVEIH